LTEFFATYFGFLSGIYSITYAVVNGIVLRLGFAAEILLIYLAIETIIPKTRNSLASTLRSALYVTTSMTINVLLFSVLIEYFDKDRLHGFFLLDLTSLTDSPHLPVRIVGWIAAALAAVRTIGCLQRRSRRQADHHHHAGQRKSDSCRLRLWLRIDRLVLFGIGHRQARAIDQLDRPCQRQCNGAFWLSSRPLSRASPLTIDCGSLWRARQYAPVRTLIAPSPSATRCAAQPLTAFWHDPSACSACCMNIDSVTVGGYNRSRCSGIKLSLLSISSGLVSTLKNSIACIEPARRSILLARCCRWLRALRSIAGAFLGKWVGCLRTPILSIPGRSLLIQ